VRRTSDACILADLGRCGAPCDHRQSVDHYAGTVAQAARMMRADAAPVIAAMHQRIDRLVADERFEEAARLRDQLTTFLRGAATSQRIGALSALPLVAAAAPSSLRPRHWDLVVIRHGRLAATSCVPHAPRLRPAMDALIATSAQVDAHGDGLPWGHIDEALAVLAWLEADGVRLVEVDGSWTLPIGSAAGRIGLYRRARLAAIQRSSSVAADPSSNAVVARSRA
jgi:DNA polymerase-3 subunit epsilon